MAHSAIFVIRRCSNSCPRPVTIRTIAKRSFVSSTAGNAETASSLTHQHHDHAPPPSFDLESIRQAKPFTKWLASEMRSNHAGETGAVQIYCGALYALDLRRSFRVPLYSNSVQGDQYEANLRAFSMEHRDSEQSHVDLLEGIMDEEEQSKLLPAWRVAGFGLGFVSTIFCPRGMYLTTEAVESFVEEHYGYQIRRLKEEIGDSMAQGVAKQPIQDCEITLGKKELMRMLQHCCEDEVEHKNQARERHAEGPFPWFDWVDTSWQYFVGVGSLIAADCAKKV
eukprot:6335227-Ditylum_brightwellii.AAC.1